MAGKRTIIDSQIVYGKDDIIYSETKSSKIKTKPKKRNPKKENPKSGEGKNGRKKNRKKRALIAVAVIIVLLVASYLTFTFSDIAPIKYLRELYIGTAMTTDEHQWLATWFFPKSVIDKVMSQQAETFVGINEADVNIPGKDNNENRPDDILGQKNLTVGGKDYTGREVLVNDIEQGIVVSRLSGPSYEGKIMLVDDPSRVFLGVTPYWGSRGLFMTDMLSHYDAIGGINASGFSDPGGHGDGEKANSGCRYNGENYGSYRGDQLTFGFNEDDKMVLGMIDVSQWDSYSIRDCCQFFGPALVVNGEQQIYQSSYYGLHPRSVIGQRADGVVLLMIIDGRQPGYSLGATLDECAEIMVEYNAVSAAACDGGSSAVLGYDGRIITTPSTSALRSTGRYLPNAWLVKRK